MRVLQATKRVMDEQVAFGKVQGCCENITILISALKSFSSTEDNGDTKAKEDICQQARNNLQCLDIQAACKESANEDGKQESQALGEQVTQLQEVMDQEFFHTTSFGDLLANLWAEGATLQMDTEGYEFQVLPLLLTLSIQGAMQILKHALTHTHTI